MSGRPCRQYENSWFPNVTVLRCCRRRHYVTESRGCTHQPPPVILTPSPVFSDVCMAMLARRRRCLLRGRSFPAAARRDRASQRASCTVVTMSPTMTTTTTSSMTSLVFVITTVIFATGDALKLGVYISDTTTHILLFCQLSDIPGMSIRMFEQRMAYCLCCCCQLLGVVLCTYARFYSTFPLVRLNSSFTIFTLIHCRYRVIISDRCVTPVR